MQVIIAPDEEAASAPSLFLAGGISHCADWQSEMTALLADTRLTLINPRRARFDIRDPTVAAAQIRWEYRYLRDASAVLFLFPPETLCPITLFELGEALERDVPVFVGWNPAYTRRSDVRIQTALACPALHVANSLPEPAAQIMAW